MPCQNSTTEFVKFWWPQDQRPSPKLSTNGTRPWLVWWLISVKPWLTPKNSLTYWSNVKTRFKLVSRLVWTPKCLQDFLQLCFTLPKNLEVWVCCPWATFWFLKVIWDGPSKLMLESPISDLAWVMRKINWFQISTGNNFLAFCERKFCSVCHYNIEVQTNQFSKWKYYLGTAKKSQYPNCDLCFASKYF